MDYFDDDKLCSVNEFYNNANRLGFNFTNEKCALRWMARGDTLYEVEIPSDGEIYEIENNKTPGGIIIANKIILKNPISISSELLNHFYEVSNLPLKTYFECVGLLASRGYYDLALRIIKDKVTMESAETCYEAMMLCFSDDKKDERKLILETRGDEFTDMMEVQ